MANTIATDYRTRGNAVCERYGVVMTAAYVNGDTDARNAVRRAIKRNADAAILNASADGFVFARIVAGLADAAKNAARDETAPTELLTARVRELLMSALLIANGNITPDGIDNAALADDESTESGAANSSALAAIADAISHMCAYTTGFDIPASDAPEWQNVYRIAGQRLAVRAPKQSIQAAFDRAFNGRPIGTVLTVAEIVKYARTDYHAPGAGAISAVVDSDYATNCRLNGYETVARTATTPLSFRSI